MSWVITALEEWGTWLRTKGAGQGWGGSLDLDRLREQCRAGRVPGVHSDPTLAELLATEADDQSRQQRINRYIVMMPPRIQLTAILRYAGRLEPVEDPEPRDHCRWVVSRGAIAHWDIEMGGPVWFRETHGLPPAQIGSLMGIEVETVYEHLSTLREKIRAELLQDAKIRKIQRAARRQAA